MKKGIAWNLKRIAFGLLEQGTLSKRAFDELQVEIKRAIDKSQIKI